MIHTFVQRPSFARPRRAARRGAAALGVAFAALSGCFNPDLSIPDCAIPCLQDCPSGSECRNHFCARTGSDATCVASGGNGGSGGDSDTTSTQDGGASGVGDGGSAAGAAGASTSPGALQISVASTPSLCPSQSYDLQLTASGGVPPYTWLLDSDNAPGTQLSSTSGAQVGARGIASKAQPALKLSVQDASGASLAKNIAFEILNVGPGLCPAIDPSDLPSPCVANDYYAANIVVSGGTAPFTWKALSIPAGLSFDAAHQVISGIALAAGASTPLTLQVTDSLGHETQMAYPLTYRDKCWLGFKSLVDGASQLHLFDPALAKRAPLPEASSNNVGVVDFKFSPDGKFLVYRRSSNARQDLVLLSAPNWQEQLLDFGGSVLEYSWSTSSAVLAVAFQDDSGVTQLGGLNVSNAGAPPWPHLKPVLMMDPASAPLDSPLLWIQGDQYLAFHSDAFPGIGISYDYPAYAHLTDAGFSAPTLWDAIPYLRPMQLRAAQNGVFVVDPAPQIDFDGTAGGKDLDFYLRGAYVTGVADPAGRYVALPSGDKLQVFSTAESGGTPDPPTKWAPSTDDCNSILAWDAVNERVACDARVTGADSGTDGEVRFFSLNGDRTISAQAIRGLSGYEQGASVEHRRSFSSAGNWFAFATDAALYIADAHAQSTPQLLQQVPRPVSSPPASLDALAFSPNEELLLWQLNGQLAIIVLYKNGAHSFYAQDPLFDPEACQEEFPAGPDQWCGRAQKPEPPAWAPDSRFAAALTAGHAIRVFDFGQYAVRGAFGYSDACQAGCADDFAFQP